MSYFSEVENRPSLDGPGCGTACSCGPCTANLSGLGERYEKQEREAAGSRDSLSFYGLSESVAPPKPPCGLARRELVTLSVNVKTLTDELSKGVQADARKLALKRKLLFLEVEVIIKALDTFIADGCCEQELRTLEADAIGLNWPTEAQPLRKKLVLAIMDAEMRARQDFKHCPK